MAAWRLAAVVLAAAALAGASVLDDDARGDSQGSRAKKHTTEKVTSTTVTTTSSTRTTSTSTHTTTTFTTSTTSTSTSTTGPHVYGGETTQEAFRGWLSVWRSKYQTGLWRTKVGDPWESLLPKDLRRLEPLVVAAEGGVAAGVVTEGMGYGIMVEGLQAARGCKKALKLGLALTKSWLGLVQGPGGKKPMPYAGGANYNDSATKVGYWPYGVSAVEWSHAGLGAAGLPAWKFPLSLCEKGKEGPCMGSAADGDQDAVLGMIYLAGALGFPDDFVDMVMRTVISFASADLGFPDLYRTLPNGEVIYVPKLGSMWGGLLPAGGKYKSKQQPWCYSPGYFAPAHYRTFRDFVAKHWRREFDDYLPPHLNGDKSTMPELTRAFNSAVSGGYNILYYSSCSSGSVSNWVGVKAECIDNETLHCPGVPWEHTPWVGSEGGTCEQSGTKFGSYGADASRAAWRVALDYALFREESADVTMYDRLGLVDGSIKFGAQEYLNRIVVQYSTYSICDGGVNGSCMKYSTSPYELAHAFDTKHYDAPNVNCSNVPNPPESWWAGFMAYPTFAAFIAPYDEIPASHMTQWMDTFSSICNFSNVNFTDYNSGKKPVGKICLTSYFEVSQAVISTMIMSGSFEGVPLKGQTVILKAEKFPTIARISESLPKSAFGMTLLCFGGVGCAATLFAVVMQAGVSLAKAASRARGSRRLLGGPYRELADSVKLVEAIEHGDAA